MKYLLTIYTDESYWDTVSEEESKRLMDAYWAVDREAQEAGVFIASEGLQPVATATTVRIRGGETMLTDGPFAETKEQLGGFYLLDCKDLDEALRYAVKIPGAAHGSVEVRPVMDYGEPPAGDSQQVSEGAAS